jgi:hypothetical protein
VTAHPDEPTDAVRTSLGGCPYCLDGFTPLRGDPVLGTLFTDCVLCRPPCPACDGRGVWVTTCCLPHFVQRMVAAHDLVPVFCQTCGSLVELRDHHGRTTGP